jgi:hypothetical protein
MMAAIKALIPVGAAGVVVVEPDVLVVVTGVLVLTRPATGIMGASSLVVAAVEAVLVAGFGAGGAHVTQPARGLTVAAVVFVVVDAPAVSPDIPSTEFATGSRPATSAAKEFIVLVACPEVVDPVCAPRVCAGTRVGIVRVTEC